jgi:hypothetical protein
MAPRYVFDININDTLSTVIKKCNANFKAITSRLNALKSGEQDIDDIVIEWDQNLSDAIDDLVGQIQDEATIRNNAIDDLENTIELVDGKFLNLATVANSGDYNDLDNKPIVDGELMTHDNEHSFANPTASGNVYGNTWRCHDSEGTQVGYAQVANTPTGVYRSFAVTNPRSGSAGNVGLYLYSNDDGTMDANLTAGCTWRADDIPDGMPAAKITSDSTTVPSSVIEAASGWSIVTVNAKRWGKICALTVQAKKSSAITLPVTGDIDNQVIGTLKTGYLPADYAMGICSTNPGLAMLYTNGEIRWLTATPRSTAGSVAANTNLYFRFHYMLA